MSEKLKQWEEKAEELREHLHNLLDELEGQKNAMQSSNYQTLRYRLTELHSQLDRIDALLAEKAIKTDEPDKPLTDVTF